MAKFESQIFMGHHVVDGNSYLACTFHDCVVVYRGGETSIEYCQFVGSTRLSFEGAAANSIAFLRALQSGGLSGMVQPIVNAIVNPHIAYGGIGQKVGSLAQESGVPLGQLGEACNLEWFRFLERPEYADDFVRGRVRISTLNACRGYEKAGQGDKDEGTISYTHRNMVSGDPSFNAVAERLGLPDFGPNAMVSISNNMSSTRIPDAFVLCCTRTFNASKLGPTFGRHCVRIRNPQLVFRLLTAAIGKHHELGDCFTGSIEYADRHHRDLEPVPGLHAALVKPKDDYAEQQEERMIWQLKSWIQGIAPIDVVSPGISDYCERIA